jgi:hypothetical protein
MNLVIVGWGNLAHAIAFYASHYEEKVTVLSQSSLATTSILKAKICDGTVKTSRSITVTQNAQEALKKADVVLFTLPSHLMSQKIKELAPFLKQNHIVGSVVGCGGFVWMMNFLAGHVKGIFALQRSPYICRVIEKGKSVDILGFKKELSLCLSKGSYEVDVDMLHKKLTNWFQSKISFLQSFLEVTISNSNPILHTCRLYSLQNDSALNNETLFYTHWDKAATKMLIACDKEIQNIISHLPQEFPMYRSIEDYYEVTGPDALRKKICSIEAFKKIKCPLLHNRGTYRLDVSSRYFQEDVPFGLVVLKSLAELVGVSTPNMDEVLKVLQNLMDKEYIIKQSLVGVDIKESGSCSNFGVHSLEDIINI